MTAPLPADLPLPPSAAPSLRLCGPSDLVAAVPHLLGFTPDDSLVVVALHHSATAPRVAATLRVDLSDDPVGYVIPFLRSVHVQGARDVVALAYPEPDQDEPSLTKVVDALRGAVHEAGLSLTDAMRVQREPDGWRYRSWLCADPGCCPPWGRHVPADAPVVAEAVGRGLVALPSRAAVAAELATDVRRVLEVRSALRGRRLGRTAAWRTREVGWLDAVLAREPAPVAAGDAARMLTALRDVRVRDAMFVTPGAVLGRPRQVWLDLVCCAPTHLRAAPATLLAATYLAEGGGVRATVALEVALTASPGYRMAWLLQQSVTSAVPPPEVVGLLVRAAEVERGLRPPLTAGPAGGIRTSG